MKLEVISLATADNVGIFGGYWEPVAGGKGGVVDAWLLLPGTSGAFYSQVQGPFAAALAEEGYPVLTLSTRGHDLAWVNRPDGRMMGWAAEIISEAEYDIQASLNWLSERGFSKIGLLGHSLGGIKSTYFLAHGGDPRINVFVSVASPSIGRTRRQAGPTGPEIEACLAEAEALIAAGKGTELHLFATSIQGSGYFTPNAFVDRHGSDKYEVAALASGIKVPTIFICGGSDPVAKIEFLTEVHANATSARPSEVVTIPEADHFFGGGKSREAIAEAVRFTRSLG